MAEMISEEDALYALEIVRKICETVGPGLAGSQEERQRAEIIRQELEAHLGGENVSVEEFCFAPGGFHGVLRSSALFTLLAVLLNLSLGLLPGIPPLLTMAASLVCASLAALPALFDSILYMEFVDRFLKQKRSQNVTGKLRKPGTEQVRRVLILSGHHDSALEFTWLRCLNAIQRWANPPGEQDSARTDARYRFLAIIFVTLTVTMFLGFFSIFIISLVQMAFILAGSDLVLLRGTPGWILLSYPLLPSIIVGLFYIRGTKNGGNVPGAADNLAASALVVAMCRFLVRNPEYLPEDTELRLISFGSEESGLRGSRRYVARHLEELQRLDARVLNFEVVAHPEISILTTDVSGVKNDPDLVGSVKAAAERASVPHAVVTNPTGGGGSDAGSFTQAGFKAVTLQPMKMPHQMIAFYHQKWDTPEVLSIEPLFNALKLVFEWVRQGGK